MYAYTKVYDLFQIHKTCRSKKKNKINGRYMYLPHEITNI